MIAFAVFVFTAIAAAILVGVIFIVAILLLNELKDRLRG